MYYLPLILDGNSPLLQKDWSWLGNGWKLDRSDFLLADPAVGAEEDLDADGYVVLPQKQHVLSKILIFFALELNIT